MGSKVTLFDSSEDHKDLTKKKFLSKVTFTFDMNRMYARKCLENKLYEPESSWFVGSYIMILKKPPSVWKTDRLWFIIAWLNNTPIGIINSIPNIYVKPQYRNFGLGTELLKVAMQNHPDEKFNFILNADPAILSLSKKFPDRVSVKRLVVRDIDMGGVKVDSSEEPTIAVKFTK